MAPVADEMLSNADTAIFEWLGNLRVDYGQTFGAEYGVPSKDLRNHPILRLFASPKRPFGDVRRMLKEQAFFDPEVMREVDQANENNANRRPPLPYVLVRRVSDGPASDRFRIPIRIRGVTSNGLSLTTYRFPVPWTIRYTIELVSDGNLTMNYLQRWIQDQYAFPGAGNNEVFITVRHPAPWGDKIVPLILESDTDNSINEAVDAQGSLVRKTLDLRLEGWNVDREGQTHDAIARSVGMTLHEMEGAVPELADYGESLNTVTSNNVVVYDQAPVPPGHTRTNTTATRIHLNAENPVAAYLIDDAAEVIETITLPHPDDSVVEGLLEIDWRKSDGTTPGNITVEVLWRTTTTVTVMQSHSVAWQSPSFPTLRFLTRPADELKEVSVRVKRGVDAAVRVVLRRLRLARLFTTNLVSAGSRTQGPNLASTTTDVTVTGLTAGKAYFVGGVVDKGTQNPTLSVVGTDIDTEVTFTSDGEFGVIVTPTSDTLTLRITVPTIDATLVVNQICIGYVGLRPF